MRQIQFFWEFQSKESYDKMISEHFVGPVGMIAVYSDKTITVNFGFIDFNELLSMQADPLFMSKRFIFKTLAFTWDI